MIWNADHRLSFPYKVKHELMESSKGAVTRDQRAQLERIGNFCRRANSQVGPASVDYFGKNQP